MEVEVSTIFTLLDSMNAEVAIYRRPENYIQNHERWNIRIVISDGDAKVESNKEGSTFEETLEKAWTAVDKTTRKGLNLAQLAPPIEGA